MDPMIDCPDSCFQNFFLQYRSWLTDFCEDRNIDEIYRNWLSELKKVEPQRPPTFGFTLPCAINKKRLYYKRIIDNEASNFMNYLLSGSQAIHERESMTQFILERQEHLWTLLLKVSRIFGKQKLKPGKYLPGTQDLVRFHPEADDAWVFDYLRHQLICLWMELQENFTDYLPDEPYSEDDLFAKWFFQVSTKRISRNSYQDEVESIGIKGFKSRQVDFRPYDKGVFSYETIIKNPELFSQVEENFHHYKFINDDYDFIDGYGKQTQLSIIIIYLHSKGYFNEKTKKGKIKIDIHEIRKFFENRYKVNIYRPFYNALASEEKNMEFIKKFYWLDQISSC